MWYPHPETPLFVLGWNLRGLRRPSLERARRPRWSPSGPPYYSLSRRRLFRRMLTGLRPSRRNRRGAHPSDLPVLLDLSKLLNLSLLLGLSALLNLSKLLELSLQLVDLPLGVPALPLSLLAFLPGLLSSLLPVLQILCALPFELFC